MDETADWPAQLPVPSRGAHPSAERGACVMEYAALLSGDHHTDHPVGVHPFLATLCRRFNDVLGDEARAELVRLVPALLGTGTGERRMTADDPGFRAIVEVLGRNLRRRGIATRPSPVPPEWSDLPEDRLPQGQWPEDRIDPGTGGGTAVLDRPVDARSRNIRSAVLVWVHRAEARLFHARGDDREMVELLEEMVHEVRAAQGLAPVATSGPYHPAPPA
jgi:hypothetical protein